MKVVVVGTNHAGTTVLRALAKLNPELELVTYDRNDNISFLGCGIALWVKNEFSDPQGLFYASPDLLRKEGVQVHMRHEVIGIDPASKTITVKNLETEEVFEDTYDKLVTAVGSWPIVPPIPNIDLDGIKIVKWYQHGADIRQANLGEDVKTVAVCGAGYIGVELVDAFVDAGKKVVLFDIMDRIMPRYYDEEFTADIEASMVEAGVDIKLGHTVKEFKGNEQGHVTSVVTDKTEVAVDMVIWCVGARPRTKILQDKIELAGNGAIIVDKTMKTSDDNIYAVGDCILVRNNATHQEAYIALATTAIRSGVLAALNIVRPGSHDVNSVGFQGSNAIQVFGWLLGSTGVTETMAKIMKLDYETFFLEDNDLPEFMQDTRPVKIKVVAEKTGRIIGAQISSHVNHTEMIHFFSLAIQKQMNVNELALIDIFFLPHFNKPYNLITRIGLKALGIDYMGNQ